MRPRPILKRSRIIWIRPGVISKWPGIIWNYPWDYAVYFLGRARHSVRAVRCQSTRSAGSGLPALPAFPHKFVKGIILHQPGNFSIRVVPLQYMQIQNAGRIHSTFRIFAACFVPPKVSCGWSPDFLPMSCSPSGDCGVMTRISFLSCNTSVPPARGPMK